MRIKRSQLRRIIQEVVSVPTWVEDHFAWRNVTFTRDGEVRYINDIASPETVSAAIDLGDPVPPGANVLVVFGANPGAKTEWMHDSELLALIKQEGWHERPPPADADPSGFWNGKGEWQESGDHGLPDYDLPPATEGKMRIKKSQLRRIIREAILSERKMLPIMVNPYEDLDTMNRVANYALTNDIQGALADEMVNYENLDLDLDAMNGWVNKVGRNDGSFSQDAVVPDNWDLDKVRKFMRDLESAWMNQRGADMDAAHQADPNPGEREVIGNSLTMDYIAKDDIKKITYQVRRKGGEPSNINIEYKDGGTDYGNITADQAQRAGFTLKQIEDVLYAYGAKPRKKRAPVRHTPPMYD